MGERKGRDQWWRGREVISGGEEGKGSVVERKGRGKVCLATWNLTNAGNNLFL